MFAAFEFDPETAKDIDGIVKEKTGMTFLTAQINADLLNEDLKKKRASNQGFWLVERPDVDLQEIEKGEQKGRWEAEVRGFDYYDTRTRTIEAVAEGGDFVCRSDLAEFSDRIARRVESAAISGKEDQILRPIEPAAVVQQTVRSTLH